MNMNISNPYQFRRQGDRHYKLKVNEWRLLAKNNGKMISWPLRIYLKILLYTITYQNLRIVYKAH